jgi:uncharacterized damage-inducible protein DinB
MSDVERLLEESLTAWSYTREGVIAECRYIPEGQFTFQPTDRSRDVAALAAHIIEAGLMAAGELSRPDGNFTRQAYPAFIREYAGTRAHLAAKEPLMDLLRATHDESIARLRTAGAELMLTPIVQFNGEPAARLTWLHHAIGHEEYHRGQLALYARLLGHVPALTQLIEG